MKVEYRGRLYELPRGYVLVEWFGEQAPLDDEWVKWKVATGQFTPDQAEVLREMQRIAIKPSPGHRRIMHADGVSGIKGLSRRYIWGDKLPNRVGPGEPGSYVQLCTARDADLLTGSDSGNEFRVYDNDGEADRRPPRLILPASGEIHLVNRKDFRRYGDFRRTMGAWRPR